MDSTELTQFYQAGRCLQAQEIANLETIVEANPSDTIARVQLLGYYSLSKKLENTNYLSHALWIVENVSGGPVADFVAYGSHGLKRKSNKIYELIKDRWLKQVEGGNTNPIVAIQASVFCRSNLRRRRLQIHL